jgi:hypothetical protein
VGHRPAGQTPVTRMAYGLSVRLPPHGRMRESVASDHAPAYRPGPAPQGCAAPGSRPPLTRGPGAPDPDFSPHPTGDQPPASPH